MPSASNKQQFNIYLTPELIVAVKHAAVDDEMSLSDWVERALQMHLRDRKRRRERKS